MTFAKPLENNVRGSSTTTFRGDPKYASERRPYAGTVHSMPVRSVIKDPRDNVSRRGQYSTFMDPRHHGNITSHYGSQPLGTSPLGYNPNASQYGSFRSNPNNPSRVDPNDYSTRTRNYGGSTSPRSYSGGSTSPRNYAGGSTSPRDFTGGSTSPRNYSGGSTSPRDYGNNTTDPHSKSMQYRHMQNDPAREYVLKLEGTDISNDVMV